MKLTLNQAAKECGRAKSTLSKAIKTGKLSHEKGEKGAYLIDRSELHRLFPPTSNEVQSLPIANTKNEHGNSNLQTEVEVLRAKLENADLERTREREQLTEQIEALRKMADEQRADFRQTLAVLTDQRSNSTPTPTNENTSPEPVGQGAKVGWFDKLLGRA